MFVTELLSFALKGAHMSLPPVTTVQQPNTLITTTAVNPTSSNQTPPPAIRSRPAGSHAKSFGFDWNKRADQHKYLIKSGLPEVHAAIVNDDWDLALELIGPDDFGLLWLPPASQRQPQNGGTDLDASSWTVDLLNKNENIRNNAILRMALHINHVTSQDNTVFYGANLLTLCLSKPARPDFLQHVITLAAKQAPQYLNLPDALGRTPLWVALENQDQASMHLLLKAGADPLQACKFSAQGTPKSPLSIAAKNSDKEIFRDLLRAVVEHGKKSTPYNFNDDPLFVKRWASVHSSEDVLWLADQVEALRGPLLCCEDISGSSYFYRSVIDGSLDNTLDNGNEDLIEWLRKLDTSPTVSEDIESSPLYAAASQASVNTYKELENFFFGINKKTLCDDDMDDLYEDIPKTDILFKKMEEKFFLNCTAKDFDHYLDSLPESLQVSKSNQKYVFIQKQLQIFLRNQYKLNFDDYARIVKSFWPFISDNEKNIVLYGAALVSDGRMELIFGMLDFDLNHNSIEAIALKLANLN
jgi:ankyrin repeat protein